MQNTRSTTSTPERVVAEVWADRPARIHRPRTAKWEPRLEGTPEEARQAAALIRAAQKAS